MSGDPAWQKSILRQVLLWNLGLFVGLGVAGWVADSSALMANAVDNASDAAVYLISYLAIDRQPAWKRWAAMLSGIMLLLFGSIAICVGWLLPEGSVPGSLGRWNSSSHKLWV